MEHQKVLWFHQITIRKRKLQNPMRYHCHQASLNIKISVLCYRGKTNQNMREVLRLLIKNKKILKIHTRIRITNIFANGFLQIKVNTKIFDQFDISLIPTPVILFLQRISAEAQNVASIRYFPLNRGDLLSTSGNNYYNSK